MLKQLLLAVTAASIVSALPALGETVTGTVTFTNGTDSGTLNITATPVTSQPPGTYILSGISGTTDGVAVAGVIPPGVYPSFPGDQNDNLIHFPAQNGGYLDFNGLSYSLTNGTNVNIFYVPPTDFDPGYFTDINNVSSFTPLSFDVTSVSGISGGPGAITPEPESLALAGTGIVGLAGILRRRFAC